MTNCIRCGRQLPPLMFGKKICQWCKQHEAAQRGELSDDAPQPVMPAPWVRRGESSITVTQVLLGANVMVFIAMVLASGSVMDFPGNVMVHFGANAGPYTLSGQWWRIFTYMFLHGGLMHIAFNMWCLWDLGAMCESLYGRWTFAAIYLLTGIAGGLASVAWNPGTLSVGASGAIFGLAGALISSFYLGEFSLPSFAIKGTLRSLLFFVGFNVLFGSLFPGIDNACHAGGLVSGLILGALIARVAPLRPPVLPEPARQGEDPSDCNACRCRDEGIWFNDRWRLTRIAGVGVPLALMLHPRDHYDMADLPDELAAELGLLTTHIVRHVEALPHISRAHVYRIGDGGAHLHVWFFARPEGQAQLYGSWMVVWDDLLPEYPADVADTDAAIVADSLVASYGGRRSATSEPPHA